MAFDRSFLLALLLLVVGCGLLKGNISTQVGSLYPPDNVAGRTRAFAIFSMGINSGAILGPLAIGLLADRYGWHLGFGLAGCLMLIGLLTYMAGYRMLPAETGRAGNGATEDKTEHQALGRDDWKIIGALAVVMLITVFHSIAFYQNSNMALIWIGDWVDLRIAGFRIPVSWFNSIDPAASIAFVPVLFALWRFQSRRRMQRDELRLIGEGAWIAAAANIVLALASLGGHKVSAVYPLLYDLLLGISFLYYWPTLLALVSRTAPPRAQATLMGAAFLSLFVANNIIGIIGTWYERMTPTAFWSLNAGIAAAGGALAILLRRPLARILDLSVATGSGEAMSGRPDSG